VGLGNIKVVQKKKPAKKQKVEEVPVPEDKPLEQKPAEVFTLDESVSKFEHLPLSDKLKEILQKEGFDNLTKIQREAIPKILTNRNVVLKSETGSGKTLAYLVPMLEYLSHYSLNVQKIHREQSGTMAIIFSPTRELAVQIDVELKRLLKLFYYMVSTTIMGGESAAREKGRLRKGCVILICTPGRLLYHLKNTQSLKLDNLQTMIFDEADRMLDMGFEKEMNECLEIIREKAHTKF
jgi:ATP-dependent RNA helicase DDX31/DBP7